MDPGLRGVSVEALAIRIAWETIHDSPGSAARLVDLQAEIVMRARDGVVMLMHDEMRASRIARVLLVKFLVCSNR